MGEIADSIIEGECCQLCGVYFEDEAPGYPRTCAGCGGGDEREERRQKKASNQAFSTDLLRKSGFAFQVFNGGVHLRVEKDVDFWPSTGLWMHKGEKKRGVRKLIKFLNARKVK